MEHIKYQVELLCGLNGKMEEKMDLVYIFLLLSTNLLENKMLKKVRPYSPFMCTLLYLLSEIEEVQMFQLAYWKWNYNWAKW